MPVYDIAGLKVGFEPKYDMLRERAEKYRTDESADFNVKISDEFLKRNFERSGCESIDVYEYLWVGYGFNLKLLEYNGMYLHSSTVVVDGVAYSFSAPCGTGKSTHTGLWLKFFGDKAYILNDDKAAYRKSGGEYYAFGTPFSGKYDINEKTSAKLGAVCFIERAAENSVIRISPDDAVSLILSQTVRPPDEAHMDMLLDFLDKFIAEVPVYKVRCNMELSAAEVSYNAIKRDIG